MKARALRLCAALAMLSLAAAGRRHTPPPPLPLPPTPPPGGPPGLVAPTPNIFLAVPNSPSSDGPTVAPAWMASRSITPSQGFIPGSQVLSRPDGHVEIAPGISLKLPLH